MNSSAVTWYWIRHGAVDHSAGIIGQLDVDCLPIEDNAADEIVTQIQSASIAYVSKLKRTRQTLDALLANGFKPKTIVDSARVRRDMAFYNTVIAGADNHLDSIGSWIVDLLPTGKNAAISSSRPSDPGGLVS